MAKARHGGLYVFLLEWKNDSGFSQWQSCHEAEPSYRCSPTQLDPRVRLGRPVGVGSDWLSIQTPALRRIYEPIGSVDLENSVRNPTITAFERSPDGGKGLARDTRVRWALEEVGQPYEVRLVSFKAMKEPAHLMLHPFGQIPTYEEGDLVLFETGAIVFHIAEHYAGLFPDDANARARAITWMFAALNTVEPPILELVTVKILERDRSWTTERLALVEDRIRNRLGQLSSRLGDADWLDGAFSAGDLMMVSVLLRLRPSGILDGFPNLATYVARGEARPAYKRAFAAQLAINAAAPPS